jgi:vesicle-fusing ATPase
MSIQLEVSPTPSPDHVWTNHLYISPSIKQKLPSLYARVETKNGSFIYNISVHDKVPNNCIALSSVHRNLFNIKETEKVTVTPIDYSKNPLDNNSFVPVDELTITLAAGAAMRKVINYDQFKLNFLNDFRNQVLSLNQEFVLKLSGNTRCTVTSLINLTEHNKFGIIHDDITLVLETPDPRKIIIENQPVIKKRLFKTNFNLLDMGIGGLDDEFQTIFRRAFASRRLSTKVSEELGIKHIKGILLYGPPGCGKTLIAKQIGKGLECADPKIVAGPELLDKMVGGSEAKVRALFEDAIADKNEENLHLIICDEFDSIGKTRDSISDNTGVNTNIVNQLLSMIDGPHSLNNILLICMTNNKNAIDSALLRPGRLEVQIEINLPDEKGRNDILKIHTKKMIENNYTDNSVNLKEIAGLSKNFTGAELEGVVKSATSYAISREISFDESKDKDGKKTKEIKPIVTHQDFIRALDDITPMFGKMDTEIDGYTKNNFIFWSPQILEVYNTINADINQLQNGNILSFALSGKPYIGKTSLACKLAKDSGIACIRLINAEKLLRYQNKAGYIASIFEQCSRADNSLIILDGFERLIEFTAIRSSFNNTTLQAIMVLINKQMQENKKMTVIITCNKYAVLEDLEIAELIDDKYEIDDQIQNTVDICPEYKKYDDGMVSISDVFRFMKKQKK